MASTEPTRNTPSRPPGHARLGDLLVERGVVRRNVVEQAAEEARTHRLRLGELLVQRGLAEESAVYRALGSQRGLALVEIDAVAPHLDPEVVRALPRVYLDHNALLPVCLRDGALILATDDPTANADDAAKALGSHAARLLLVTPTDLRRLWMLSDVRQNDEGATEAPGATSPEVDPLLHADLAHEAHCVALFDALLAEAVAARASDIHVECYGAEVRIRLRVDGDLQPFHGLTMTKASFIGLTIVIKVAAKLDITERRQPQGGRLARRAGGLTYDVRVQTQPSLHGEHVTLRLLPEKATPITIEELGFTPAAARDYRRLLDSPGGLVLVVGPTGSGKSTTLYAGLQRLALDRSRKVITIEDPIEYAIDGIQQVQVRPEIGFAFANATRSFVRGDPDVLVVGEVRDSETALEAIRASQTGHLVLSTLHCNDSVDAVQRLIDLGMHPNSIASEALAVIAQRLAKRICLACRVPADLEPGIAGELFPRGVPAGFRAFRGAGCAHCSGHGTRGRIAVIEFLHGGGSVRRAIARAVSVDQLRTVALGSGLVTMRRMALDLVLTGVIPLAELPWVLPAERLAEDSDGDEAAIARTLQEAAPAS